MSDGILIVAGAIIVTLAFAIAAVAAGHLQWVIRRRRLMRRARARHGLARYRTTIR